MSAPRLPALFAGLFLFLITLSGCSTNSEIARSYVDPTANKRDLEGVLIVAVAPDQASRIDFEEAFAKVLKKRGVRAETSHTRVAKMDASAEELVVAANETNLGTILITRYVGEKAEDVYHPGTVYYGLMPAYGASSRRAFGGYYAHAYEVAYDQPVWTTNRTYTVISDLFTTATREHLWQAVSDTIQAGSDNKLRDDIIRSFVDQLKKNGLLD
jgi:hypothetical protein